MTDPITTSKSARESLARGLSALQADPSVPPQLIELAAPIAQAMGALHQIERTRELVPHAEVALTHVRGALAQLQAHPTTHPAVARALEAVAASLGLVHALSKAVNRPPAPQGGGVHTAPTAQPTGHAPQAAAPQAAAPQAAAPQAAAPQAGAPKNPTTQAMAQKAMPEGHAAHAQTSGAHPAQGAPPVAYAQTGPHAPQGHMAGGHGGPAHGGPAHGGPAHGGPAHGGPAHAGPAMGGQPTNPQAAFPRGGPMAHAASQPMIAADPFASPPAAAPGATSGPPMQLAPEPARASMPVPSPPAGNLQVIAADLGAHSATNFYKGLSGNDIIDHGGLFVSTYAIPKINTPIRLKVSLPGGYEFEANAIVKWTREDGGGDAPPGFGAQFNQITPEARQLVYRYVRNREPLFHDDL